MAIKVFLSAHSMHFHKVGNADDVTNIDAVRFNGNTLCDELETILTSMQSRIKEAISGKSYRCVEFTINQARTIISGHFRFGTFGETGEILDTDTEKKLVDVAQNHSLQTDYWFTIYMPPGKKHAVMICQRKGVNSLYTTIRSQIIGQLGTSDDDEIPKFEHVCPAGAHDSFANSGVVDEIVLIRSAAPETINTGLDSRYFAPSNKKPNTPNPRLGAKVTVSIKPTRNYKYLNPFGILDMFGKDNFGPVSAVGFADEGEYDEIEVVVRNNNRTRKYRRGKNTIIDLEVTDDVIDTKTGEVDSVRMRQRMLEYASEAIGE